MNFKTYLKVVQIIEFVIYLAVAMLLMYVIFPFLNMSRVADVILTMLGVVVAFVILIPLKRELIFRNTVKKSLAFYKTLDDTHIQGISEYFERKVRTSLNPVILANNVFMAYATHDYTKTSSFYYIQNILDMEKAYDEYFFFKVIQVREMMIFRLIQTGQLEQFLELALKLH